jgi:hypothetical protein
MPRKAARESMARHPITSPDTRRTAEYRNPHHADQRKRHVRAQFAPQSLDKQLDHTLLHEYRSAH